jgi:hypothetical protein
MNDENIRSLCLYLTSSPKQQVTYILKTITKDQLQIILEILYNIVNGILAISNEDKQKLKKHKTILRKLIAPDLKWTSRKKLLWKIRHLVPVILQSYLKHVKRTRTDSEEKI